MDGDVIFIDESGDPGLSREAIECTQYYTVGFIYCREPSMLRTKLKRLLKKEHERKRYPLKLNELKFHLPKSDLIGNGYNIDELYSYEKYLPAIREKALKLICENTVGVFAATLNKNKAFSSWTSERIGNYIFAQTLLVDVINSIYPRYPPSILFDGGRLSPTKTSLFKDYLSDKDRYLVGAGLKSYVGHLPIPSNRNSVTEPGIWAADLVAGSFRHKYVSGDSHYADLLKAKYIGIGEKLYWP
ncbi:MAG: DUF3800 domain-containing protein [Methanothrix sp.]